MMRRFWWVVLLLVAAGPAWCEGEDEVSPAAGMIRLYAGGGRVAVGDWLLDLQSMGVIPAEARVTGFGFGPGRAELAYCGLVLQEGRSALWVIPVAMPEVSTFPVPLIEGRARLLWVAPASVTLRGPIRWAPDGTKIALQGCRNENCDLVCVDYLSGKAVMLTEGVRVVEAAWHPQGKAIAYVAEDSGKREVWLRTVLQDEARLMGEGGFNLRWSLDGELSWLRPDSSTAWMERLWDPEEDRVRDNGVRPARPRDAEWSPDGMLCAVLEPVGETDEKQLVICPSGSTAREVVPLPEARPQRLLGWSSDSNLILVLAEGDYMLAVSARPPGPGVIKTLETQDAGSKDHVLSARGSLTDCAIIDPEAGRPAWSSGSDLLACVWAREERYRKAFRHPVGEMPYGQLVVQRVRRRYLKASTVTGKPEGAQVVSNMKNVALGLQMYLADNNDVFPPVDEIEALRGILREYVYRQAVFMRPGTEDEVVVRYLVPPGLQLVEVRDPEMMPVAVVDYHPDFFVVAYGDGHVKMYDKEGDYWEKWEAWWREFEAERAAEGR